MLKLSHKERSVAIAALVIAERLWDQGARAARDAGNGTESQRLAEEAGHAHTLCQRYEEEQS